MGGVTKGARLEKEGAGPGSHFASCPSEAVTFSKVKKLEAEHFIWSWMLAHPCQVVGIP